MARANIRFRSRKDQCAGWFYEATAAAKAACPCIVMAHGLAGTKEMRLDAYAERFVAAGYNVLVFDYRYFGESEGQPRQLLSIPAQLQDWLAAIAYVRSLPSVDSAKIALWGSSLSGGHVIVTAARDKRVAAVISQVPHMSGLAGLAASGPLAASVLTVHGLYDALRGVLGLTPHYVLSSGEPGETALITAPGESVGYLNLVPEERSFDRRVAARFALGVGLYSPARDLPKLEMPSLVQVALDDLTTPPEPAIAACKRAPKSRYKQYPTGHFQPYVEPMFAHIIKDQLNFLADVLPVAQHTATRAQRNSPNQQDEPEFP